MGDWLLPLTAGFLAAFNPCGVVLLPAYVAHLVGSDAPADQEPGALVRGLGAGIGMTAGILAVFAVVGGAATVVNTAVMRTAPWLAVAVGAGLLVYGAYLLRSTSEPGAALTGYVQGALAGRGRGRLRLVIYGAAYGLASLGCTLPVFLVLVVYNLTAARPVESLLRFAAYAAGMGVAVTGVSVLSALAREAAQRWIRRLIPHLPRVSAVLLTVSGVYLIYYWFWGPGSLLLR